MNQIIEARAVTKKFGSLMAVDHLDLEVGSGQCFGILGANGAGKSTLMRMLYGSCLPSSGELFVLGMSVRDQIAKIKTKLGVVPQDSGLDFELNVLENLYVFADHHGLSGKKALARSTELLRLVGLSERSTDSVESLSGGMRRRLAIARALISDPDVLILDEPTTGLDPQARLQTWDLIASLKKLGCSVILSTHYMEEAEELCDRILILEKGRRLAEGTAEELISRTIGREVVEFLSEPQDIEMYLGKIKDRYQYQVLNNRVRVFLPELQEGKVLMQEIASDRIQIRRANLNDVFIKMAGYEVQE